MTLERTCSAAGVFSLAKAVLVSGKPRRRQFTVRKNLLTSRRDVNIDIQASPSLHLPRGDSSSMARSAVDATRFTSTTPHASAMPSAPTSNLHPSKVLPQRTAGPPGETPQEKVKRLREAAARARNAKISTFDKAIATGRVWSDKIHRFIGRSLIGITGTATFPGQLMTRHSYFNSNCWSGNVILSRGHDYS
jgi:hypothetical protein